MGCNGLNHSQTPEQRKAFIRSATEQRLAEFQGGETAYIPGTVNTLDASTPDIQREFFDFYRTERGGYTPQGQKEELTTKPMLSSIGKFMNFYPFNDIETISPRPMLFITGDQAHSKEFSEDAFKRAGQPKEGAKPLTTRNFCDDRHRSFRPARGVEHWPCRNKTGGYTQRLQRHRKPPVEFIAVAAPSLL